jgi:hypothetical protein
MTEQKTEEKDKAAKEGDSSDTPIPALGPNEAPYTNPIQCGQTKQRSSLADQIKHTDRIIARSAIITAVLTFVLVVVAGLQVYAFIESERAFFILKEIRFTYGDPTSLESSHDLTIVLKNIGAVAEVVGI